MSGFDPRAFATTLLAVLLASLGAARVTAETPTPAAPPAPYSLPWLLRPALPASVLRLDETMAFFEDPSSGQGSATYVTSLIATYRLHPS